MKWPEVALGEVATIERAVRRPDEIASGSLFVGLENIERGGALVNVGSVERDGLRSPKFEFAEDHILYGRLRPYLGKIATPDFAGVCSTDILPIRTGPRVERSYLCRFLQQPSMIDEASARAVGANLPRLSPDQLTRLRLPLPPIEEQRRIAAVLDHVDQLRAKRHRSSALASSFRDVIFADMFFPGGWTTSPLGEHLTYLTSGSRGWARYYSDHGAPFLRIQNVGRGQLCLDDLAHVSPPNSAEARRTQVRVGDVLMSITADLGRTAVVTVDADGGYINQHLCLMRSNSMSPRFLSAVLASDSVQQQIAKRNRHGVKAGLNFDDVRGLSVICPPLEAQEEFASRTAAAGEVIADLTYGADGLDSLFASLQHRAFSGQL